MGLTLGLCGLGQFGSAFAPLFKSHPLVDRVALCDREPERIERFAKDPAFAEKFNERDAYSSLEALCASDVDAIVIITQPWLHAPQAMQALEAGKHVYSAVPIVSIPDDRAILDWCDRLVDTCRRTGLHYMLGETTYYHADAMYCRRQAAEGAFGDFVYAEGEYYHDFDSPRSNLKQVLQQRLDSAAGREWIKQAAAYRNRGLRGGPMHYPTHSTAGPISVMGQHALKVACFGYRTRSKDAFFDNDAFSNETAIYQMSGGAVMRINEFREVGRLNSETFRVFGSQASYGDGVWMNKHEHTPLAADEMRDPLPEPVREAFAAGKELSAVYGSHGGSHPYLVHEFVDAIAHDRRPAIHIWEAARYMAAGVTAHQSALRDGEVLPVPDWGDPPR